MRAALVWVRVLVAALLVALSAGAGTAQTNTNAPDLAAWESVAQRAEGAIQAGRASNAAFETLREELVAWRETFASSQNLNADRIQTVRAQLEALGPPPAEGETEPTEVAGRRAELNQQLADLSAPNRQAVEAFSRAEGLIREIDTILRERQAQALMERAPMPVNPANWPGALTELTGSLTGIMAEIATNWETQGQRALRQNDLPLTLALILIGVVLLWRGRIWVEALVNLVFARFASNLGSLLISTGKVIVPVAGIFLFVAAARSLDLVGARGLAVIDALPFFVFSYYSALWVADRVFPKAGDALVLGDLPLEDRFRLRRNAGILGLLFGLYGVAANLAETETYSPATLALLFTPILALSGLFLFRIGQRLLRHARAAQSDDHVGTLQTSVAGFVARMAIVIGLAAPVAAALGYINAAQTFIYPAAMTLGLLGLLVILNRLVVDAFRVLTGQSAEEASNSLVPTLVGFAVALALTPVLAIVWGARATDLYEMWVTFRAGFTLGETRLAPGDFLTVIVVFGVGFAITRLIQKALKASVLPKTRMDAGGRNAITSGVGYVGVVLSGILAVTLAGINLSSLAIVAGALSVGIGFGLQNIVSNFVSGIILLVERPIGEGDWIEVGGTMGIVKKISVRSTTIETFDKTSVIVPNADFVSAPVTNWTRGNQAGRLIVKVGVAYGTDTAKVDRILSEIANDQPLVVVEPPPLILFAGFGADSLDFEVRMILRDVNFILNVQNDINHAIARRFAEEGIEIPFAQRDIWLRNPEALGSGGQAGAGAPPKVAVATAAPSSPAEAGQHMTDGDMDVAPDSDGDGDGR
ncbi:DUF3772 domain-containing protein [Anianabacter salinae]|uniref:DUF3772 domain-containing protein n=1 Tax=Anianabacter salinae TaxID=2851023 RepID=UPI00225DD85B|nr:DUF3772 domain-containing protein [Anianabacter salinae]MBV0912200.1 DUF3772 domain-containing protein [Anianabacter salinae]